MLLQEGFELQLKGRLQHLLGHVSNDFVEREARRDIGLLIADLVRSSSRRILACFSKERIRRLLFTPQVTTFGKISFSPLVRRSESQFGPKSAL